MLLESTVGLFAGPPLLWLTVSAFFAAATLSRLFSGKKREGVKSSKRLNWWTVAFGIIALFCGVVGLLKGSEPAASRLPLYLYLAILTAFLFAVGRFKKLTGVVIVALVSVALVVLSVTLLLRAITAFTGETSIAQVEVTGADEDGMTLKIERPETEAVEIHMKGEYFSPIVKVIIFDDLSVLLGARTWYRFVGMTSFGIEMKGDTQQFRQADTDYYFESRSGLSETIYSVFERFETAIPGVKTVQVEMDLKRVFASHKHTDQQRFSLMIQHDGGLQIVPATLPAAQ